MYPNTLIREKIEDQGEHCAPPRDAVVSARFQRLSDLKEPA
jgi:hypothetical protein